MTAELRIMRTTSLLAWKKIRETGILGRRRTQAYSCLYRYGPLTASEICSHSGIPGLWKRLSELERMGLIVAGDARICSVTGSKAIEWDVTDVVPTKPYRASDYAKKVNRDFTLDGG